MSTIEKISNVEKEISKQSSPIPFRIKGVEEKYFYKCINTLAEEIDKLRKENKNLRGRMSSAEIMTKPLGG